VLLGLHPPAVTCDLLTNILAHPVDVIGEELHMPPEKHRHGLLHLLVDLSEHDELAFSLAVLPDELCPLHQRLLGDITISEQFIRDAGDLYELLEAACELAAVALCQQLHRTAVLSIVELLITEN